MATNVLYLSYQPYTLALASELEKELGWKPVYWKTDNSIDAEVKKRYPGIVTHKYDDAIRGKLPEGISLREEALDETFLSSLSYHESIAINMMNRNALVTPFTYQERIRLYHRHLRFYTALLKKLKPEYVVFEDTPHQACDYVLYIVAQHMGIKTILSETSMILNYFITMERFEEGDIFLIEDYRNQLRSKEPVTPRLSEAFANELARIRSDYKAGAHSYMREHQKAFKNQNMLFSRIRKRLGKYVSYANPSLLLKRIQSVKMLFDQTPLNIYKHDQQAIEDSSMSNWEHLVAIKKLKKIKNRNLAYYKSVQTNDPDYSVPFIYCPLHFQPEKSTSPWGGHFTNQYLMIDMLSKNAPEGWKIYVKDHIAQYIYPETGEPVRNQTFFNDIVALPNVEILPMETNSFDLIDRSTAVASVAGTALWEGIVRGKPALAFGAGHRCWCGGCDGIFYTPNNTSLGNALQQIASGYTVDQANVELYFELIEKHGTRGYVGGTAQARESGMTAEENGRAHAHAIRELLRKHKSRS